MEVFYKQAADWKKIKNQANWNNKQLQITSVTIATNLISLSQVSGHPYMPKLCRHSYKGDIWNLNLYNPSHFAFTAVKESGISILKKLLSLKQMTNSQHHCKDFPFDLTIYCQFSATEYARTLHQARFIKMFLNQSLNFFINILIILKRKPGTVHILLRKKNNKEVSIKDNVFD